MTQYLLSTSALADTTTVLLGYENEMLALSEIAVEIKLEEQFI